MTVMVMACAARRPLNGRQGRTGSFGKAGGVRRVVTPWRWPIHYCEVLSADMLAAGATVSFTVSPTFTF